MVERVPAKVAAKAAAKRKQPDEATASGSMPILPPSKSANLELAATVAAGGDGLVVVSEKKTKEAKGGSKYKGVYADKAVASKWKSSIRINHREVHLGYYDSELEAARAYDKANLCVKGEVKNLTVEDYTDAERAAIDSCKGDIDALRKMMNVGAGSRPGTSSNRGVCREKKTKKWRAEIQINGKKESLGYHEFEEDAVKAYDRACIVLKGEDAKTNRPIEEYRSELETLRKYTFDEYQNTLQTKARKNAKFTSNFRGVRRHVHTAKQGAVSTKWRAEITKNGKKQSLGYHDTEEAAARAYDEAVKQMEGFNPSWLNFPSRGARGAAATAATTTHALPPAATQTAAGVRGVTGKSVGGVKGKKVAAAAAAAAAEAGAEHTTEQGSFLASLAD